MKWVTRDYVHLDRVASPWLIKRFVDKEAQFVFVPWGQEDRAPTDAIPLALPGAELGPHDGAGTTFQRIVQKYELNDAALERMGKVVAAGVAHVLHGFQPAADDVDGQIAVGLLAIAEGMLLLNSKDDQIIEASLGVYDALYLNFRAHGLVEEQGLTVPPLQGGPAKQVDFLRELIWSSGRNGV